MSYRGNANVLRSFYAKYGLGYFFDRDNQYLESAFNDITRLWVENLDQINEVRFIMIAEAPLWGQVQKYIYNPNIKSSVFFYCNDLRDALHCEIKDKRDFLLKCQDIGLVIVDISPFALNSRDTAITYREMGKKKYRQLVEHTIPSFFEKKIEAICAKKAKRVKVFFRYKTVKDTFQDLVSRVLIANDIIKSELDILDVSGDNMPMDRKKLRSIINPDK